MVFIHLKKNDQSVLLAQVQVSTTTDVLIESLVKLSNDRLRVERLCLAIKDLAMYGVYKPYDQHGYQPRDLDKFINETSSTASDANNNNVSGSIIIHEGREYICNPDPTGRRIGLAPLHSLADTINHTVDDVMQAIHRNQVAAKAVLSETKIIELLDLLHVCVTMAYPMGLPDYDPVAEIISNSEDPNESIHAKDIFDARTCSLWWAGKEIMRGKLLSDYVGLNNKTTIIAKLQQSGNGAPMREPPLCEQAQKDMMAYYYRKQEELKNLEDDSDFSHIHSKWANPNSLKSSFHGISGNGISWHPC